MRTTSLPAPIYIDFAKDSLVDLLELIRGSNAKVVYWDLGGTLVDIPDRIKQPILDEINARCQCEISLERFNQLLRDEWKRREDPAAQEAIKAVKNDDDELAYWIEFFSAALGEYEVDLKAPDLIHRLAKKQASADSFEIYPHIMEILTELIRMGIRVGIISNAFPSARRILKRTRLIHMFKQKHIFLSYEYNSIKPEAKLFQKAIDSVNVAPEEIVFIDDRSAFLTGAQALGMHAVMVTTETLCPVHFEPKEKKSKPSKTDLNSMFRFFDRVVPQFQRFLFKGNCQPALS